MSHILLSFSLPKPRVQCQTSGDEVVMDPYLLVSVKEPSRIFVDKQHIEVELIREVGVGL